MHKIELFSPLISPLLLFIYFLRLDFPLRLMLDNLAGLASSRAPESTFPSLPSAGIAEAYTIPLHVDVRIQA